MLQCVAVFSVCCSVVQCDADREGVLNCWYNHSYIMF